MNEDDFIPISALQHHLYCPRQCALIHVEQLWAESRHTAEGRLMHERADVPRSERRRGVRTVSGMPLSSSVLGITGVADVVEFHACSGGEKAYPVEYKRGRPKAHRADEVQLCAQALCLEEMLGQQIARGALFYGQTRRRVEVQLDDALRQTTLCTIDAVRNLVAAGVTPAAVYSARLCDSCSLLDLCTPKLTNGKMSVSTWLCRQLHLAETEDECAGS
jgi:CRISPR-associated exonuclease Cas4